MRFFRIVIWSLLSLFPIGMMAQVSSVDSEQDGNTIVITYTLAEKSDISVRVSIDGGATFTAINAVTGDVGKNVAKGKKRIVWNVLEEVNDFSFSQVCFAVDATPVRVAKNTKTAYESKTCGLEYAIPVGVTLYAGKKRLGIYTSAAMGLGYNLAQKDKDLNVSLMLGPKVGITSNVAWLLGVGVSYNYNDKDKVSNYATDILTGTATEESMFNFVLETGFVFRVSRLLLSVRCQYMMPRSVIVPLVGIGLAW